MVHIDRTLYNVRGGAVSLVLRWFPEPTPRSVLRNVTFSFETLERLRLTSSKSE